MTKLRTWRFQATWWSSVGTGVLVGVFDRLVFARLLENQAARDGGIMTLAFLFGVPIAMGYWSVSEHLRTTPIEDIRWRSWLFLPWPPVLLTMVISLLLGWEGMICILFAAPLMLVGSMLGGLLAWVVWDRVGTGFVDKVSALALPLILLAIEAQIPASPDIRTVETAILIHAPVQTVWDNIKSVRRIDPSELPHAWIERVGFPRPLEATLSHEGVGGVRQASFTGGLLFTETVNEWKMGSDLRFSIRAKTDAIPPKTLDEHVRVGGPFFDVLEGEYQLEPRSDGVLLHLASRERLSTHFNGYAGVWTDAVMRAIQEQILVVIQQRCEQQTHSAIPLP